MEQRVKISLKQIEEVSFCLKFKLLHKKDLKWICDVYNSNKKGIYVYSRLFIIFEKRIIEAFNIHEEYMKKVAEGDEKLKREVNEICALFEVDTKKLKKYVQCGNENERSECCNMLNMLKQKVKKGKYITDEDLRNLIEFIKDIHDKEDLGELLKKSICVLYRIYIQVGKNEKENEQRKENIMKSLMDIKSKKVLQLLFKKSERNGCYGFHLLTNFDSGNTKYSTSIKVIVGIYDKSESDIGTHCNEYNSFDLLWNILYDIMIKYNINCDLFLIYILQDNKEIKIKNEHYSYPIKELYIDNTKDNGNVLNIKMKEIKDDNCIKGCFNYKGLYYRKFCKIVELLKQKNDTNSKLLNCITFVKRDKLKMVIDANKGENEYNEDDIKIFKMFWNVMIGFKKRFDGNIMKMFLRNCDYFTFPRYMYTKIVVSSFLKGNINESNMKSFYENNFHLCTIDYEIFELYIQDFQKTKFDFFHLYFISESTKICEQSQKEKIFNFIERFQNQIYKSLIKLNNSYIVNNKLLNIFEFYIKNKKSFQKKEEKKVLSKCKELFNEKNSFIFLKLNLFLQQAISLNQFTYIINKKLDVELINIISRYLSEFYFQNDKVQSFNFLELLLNKIEIEILSTDKLLDNIFKLFSSLIANRFLSCKDESVFKQETTEKLFNIIQKIFFDFILNSKEPKNSNYLTGIFDTIGTYILFKNKTLPKPKKKTKTNTNMEEEDLNNIINPKISEHNQKILFNKITQIFYDLIYNPYRIDKNTKYNTYMILLVCIWFYMETVTPYLPVIFPSKEKQQKKVLFQIIQILYNSNIFRSFLWNLNIQHANSLIMKIINMNNSQKEEFLNMQNITNDTNYQSEVIESFTFILNDLFQNKISNFNRLIFYFEQRYFVNLNIGDNSPNLSSLIKQKIEMFQILNIDWFPPSFLPIHIEVLETITNMEISEYVNCESFVNKNYKLISIIVQDHSHDTQLFIYDNLFENWIHEESGKEVDLKTIKGNFIGRISHLFLFYQECYINDKKLIESDVKIMMNKIGESLEFDNNTKMLNEDKDKCPIISKSFVVILCYLITIKHSLREELLNSLKEYFQKQIHSNTISYIYKKILGENISIKDYNTFQKALLSKKEDR